MWKSLAIRDQEKLGFVVPKSLSEQIDVSRSFVAVDITGIELHIRFV